MYVRMTGGEIGGCVFRISQLPIGIAARGHVYKEEIITTCRERGGRERAGWNSCTGLSDDVWMSTKSAWRGRRWGRAEASMNVSYHRGPIETASLCSPYLSYGRYQDERWHHVPERDSLALAFCAARTQEDQGGMSLSSANLFPRGTKRKNARRMRKCGRRRCSRVFDISFHASTTMLWINFF